MQLRFVVAAGVIAGLALAAAGACSGSQTPCEAGECAGCCDAQGVCQDGLEEQACGANGGSCTACASGQSCVSGLCVGSTPPPDAGGQNGGYASMQEFCTALPSALCGALSRCGAAASTSACVQARPGLFAECTRDWIPAVNEGRASFDGLRAKACVDEIRNIDNGALPLSHRCVERDFFDEFQSCRDAVKPKLATGGTCYVHAECPRANYCTAGTSCPGTCEQRKGEGVFALSDRDCADGLYRYLGNSTCRTPVAADGDCAPLSGLSHPQRCVRGHSCLFDGAAWTCAPWKWLAEACQPFECHPLLACKNNSCTSLGNAGAACVGSAECDIGLYCNPNNQQCTDRGTTGAACTSSGECRADHFCKVPENTCQPRKLVGQECTTPDECLTLACAGNVCVDNGCHDPTP